MSVLDYMYIIYIVSVCNGSYMHLMKFPSLVPTVLPTAAHINL